MQLNFLNSYLDLPGEFYVRQNPDSLKNPQLIIANQQLLQDLMLEDLSNEDILQIFSGANAQKSDTSISLVYAGCQFGHFVPRLGDGRAVLLGQLQDKHNNIVDVQLKGSGQTAFSRSGDGKYPLGPAIKEYIMSEALFYLNIPTTRSLSLIVSDEAVIREETHKRAILSRLAKTHIRFGTFEYFAHQNDQENLKILADFVISQYYPACQNSPNPYLDLFQQIYQKQIDLVTNWMSVGFIHGVMNTDNCLINGESIDFGPCAFMEEFKKDQTFSYIDKYGRYSYQNQKPIIIWNLIRFVETLLGLIDGDIKNAIKKVEPIIKDFQRDFDDKFYAKMLKKVGVSTDNAENRKLIDEFLDLLEKHNLDFTNSFRNIATFLEDTSPPSFMHDWIQSLKTQIAKEGTNIKNAIQIMNDNNPLYIPRNHLIENIIEASNEGDYAKLYEFLDILKNPFTRQAVDEYYTQLPQEQERVQNTFCGT